VAARLESIHDKTNANQMRLEPEAEHQGKMDANLKEIKEDIKTNWAETKAIQAKADADWEHMQEMIRTNQRKDRNQDGRSPREEGRQFKGDHM
jgi:hypothetical protein